MTLTYDGFVSEWSGKLVDAIKDPYPNQCMDLVAQYVDELGLPRFWGNAADVANQIPPGYMRVSVPQRGDIVVFAPNDYNGGYGHIGIYDRPGYIFSENYYPDKRSVVQPILPNDRIIAILRPSTLNSGGDMGINPQTYKEAMAAYTDLLTLVFKHQKLPGNTAYRNGDLNDDEAYAKEVLNDPDAENTVKHIVDEAYVSAKGVNATEFEKQLWWDKFRKREASWPDLIDGLFKDRTVSDAQVKLGVAKQKAKEIESL